MQKPIENIRLVVEQNKIWLNKTYFGLVSENLKITKYYKFNFVTK